MLGFCVSHVIDQEEDQIREEAKRHHTPAQVMDHRHGDQAEEDERRQTGELRVRQR